MADISDRFKMSLERLNSIKEELQYLETVREKEVAELIKEARSFGDLSENSEYDEAKNEQGKLYSKIAELKVLIENAEIVDNLEADAPKDTVTLGSVVRVRDLEDGFEDQYEIVGSQEANPRQGRISDDSPLFQAIMPCATVSRHSPCAVQPAKGVLRPMDTNCSGSITYSFSRSNRVKLPSSMALLMPKRRQGAKCIRSIRVSMLRIPVFTSFAYSSGNAVSRPTTPIMLFSRPLSFSSAA